ANGTEAEIRELVTRLRAHLAEHGKVPGPSFEVNALAVDVLDADGFRRLKEAGVTECQVVPWFFYGGDPTALDTQVESLTRFADTVITEMED
ncbi:MAG: LLM class F420-dependent oxidoreductase, partial [Acidimicrobiales bacterium]